MFLKTLISLQKRAANGPLSTNTKTKLDLIEQEREFHNPVALSDANIQIKFVL